MPTHLLFAIAAYLSTCLFCLFAAGAARKLSRPAGDSLIWLMSGFGFASLALVRALDIEDQTREALRDVFEELGLYDGRESLQVPLGILAVLLGLGLLFFFLRKLQRAAGRPERLALLAGLIATLGFVPLYALRIISLHATDRILYHGGAFRLNWILDGGLTVAVAISALLYVKYIRQSSRRTRPANASRISPSPKRRDKR